MEISFETWSNKKHGRITKIKLPLCVSLKLDHDQLVGVVTRKRNQTQSLAKDPTYLESTGRD